MDKKVAVIITSAVLLAAAGTVAIGGVYALFQDKTDIAYHVQSGSLNVTPWLTKRYVKDYANPTGTTTAVDPVLDLSKTGAALFTLGGEDSPIYPGLIEGSEIEVKPASGTSLNVAMDLSVSLTSIKGYAREGTGWKEVTDSPLLSQIQVTIAKGTLEAPAEPSVFLLNAAPTDPYAVGSYDVKATLDAFFSIKYEFLDLDNDINNQAQDLKLSFDFMIDAVQKAIA